MKTIYPVRALFTALLLSAYSPALAQSSQADVDALYDCVDEMTKSIAMMKVWQEKFKGTDEIIGPALVAFLSFGENPRYANSTPQQGRDLEEYMMVRGEEALAFETGFAISVQSRSDYRKRVELQVQKTEACFQSLPK